MVFVPLVHTVHLGLKRLLLPIPPQRLPYPQLTAQPRSVTGHYRHQITRKFFFALFLNSEVMYLRSVGSVCVVGGLWTVTKISLDFINAKTKMRDISFSVILIFWNSPTRKLLVDYRPKFDFTELTEESVSQLWRPVSKEYWRFEKRFFSTFLYIL